MVVVLGATCRSVPIKLWPTELVKHEKVNGFIENSDLCEFLEFSSTFRTHNLSLGNVSPTYNDPCLTVLVMDNQLAVRLLSFLFVVLFLRKIQKEAGLLAYEL